MRIMPYNVLLAAAISAIMSLAVSFSAAAQEGGRIRSAQGNEFTLTVQGQRQIHRPDSLGAEGLPIGSGDMIQTGRESLVEVQLEGTVVTLAENTSFRFNGFGESNRSASMELAYGRLRITNNDNRDIHVLTGNGTVSFQSGDIGLYYEIHPGRSSVDSRPLLSISVFTGTAELAPQRADAEPISIEANESVSLEMLSAGIIVERSPLSSAPETPAAEPALEKTLEPIPYTSPDYGTIAKENRWRKAGLITGIVLVTAGAAVQGVGLASLHYGYTSRAEYCLAAGFVPIGLGITALIASLIESSP
jgi:hypothetical protein